jgi:exodeoxyribonuclease-3
MKLCSWNVNGVRAVSDKGFTEWIRKEQPDILCIQETKAHIGQLDDMLVNIDGYESYWCSAEKKGYSGVATYVKIKPLSVLYGLGIERFDSEGRVLITEHEGFTLLNIYFPNGQMSEERLKYKLDFYDAVLEYCEKMKNEGHRLIICGDYNTAHREIDIKNPKSNEKYSGFLPVEREWIDKFISHGYIDTFRYLHPYEVKYSWWSYRFNARQKNIGWRIDYFFVSDNLISSVLNADILDDVTGSDHCPIILEIP